MQERGMRTNCTRLESMHQSSEEEAGSAWGASSISPSRGSDCGWTDTAPGGCHEWTEGDPLDLPDCRRQTVPMGCYMKFSVTDFSSMSLNARNALEHLAKGRHPIRMPRVARLGRRTIAALLCTENSSHTIGMSMIRTLRSPDAWRASVSLLFIVNRTTWGATPTINVAALELQPFMAHVYACPSTTPNHELLQRICFRPVG